MSPRDHRRWAAVIAVWTACAATVLDSSRAATPNPVLETVFPAGGRAGEPIEVEVAGSGLDGLHALRCSAADIRIEQHDDNPQRFTIQAPEATPLGCYDLRAVCANGVSSPRPFMIGSRAEQLESDPNESPAAAQPTPLNTTVNGRIQKGDLDHFRFDARQGQRVVIECWCERIDSRLRAVLELLDARGRLLASNRGHFGTDPLIDFRVPADGAYVVKLHDLIYSGGPEHYYRLDIDTGPRVAFSTPAVVERGKSARVVLHGWNLKPSPSSGDAETLDRIEVDLPPTRASTWPLPARLQPTQTSVEAFPHYFPGGHGPLLIGLTDVPVVSDAVDNHTPATAQRITYPGEVSGQLAAGDEQDWYAIDVLRGEVLYIEGFGQRINSPIDLDIRVLDEQGQRELLKLADETRNIGGPAFPTNHLDPTGRWVAPADGRYLIVVRNLTGGQRSDPRRIYRLSLRREEAEFSLAATPHHSGPAGLNVARGGRAVLDVLAFRRRGLRGAIRVSAEDLPPGIECSDIWLGPGVSRTVLVVSATQDAPPHVGQLRLTGSTEMIQRRTVRGGVVVRTGRPGGWARLTSEIPLAVAAHPGGGRSLRRGHQARQAGAADRPVVGAPGVCGLLRAEVG